MTTTNPLITPSMLKVVRNAGKRMLTQTFTHLVRTTVANDYGDGEEAFVDAGDYSGWIRMMNQPDLRSGEGLVSAVGSFRLHLEHTVNLEEGDLVADASGNLYTVNDVNTEDTVKVYTTAMVQKLQ